MNILVIEKGEITQIRAGNERHGGVKKREAVKE